MANPPGWVYKSKLNAVQGSLNMAGVAAGVVTEAQVNRQPKMPTKLQVKLSNPAAWSYIWVGAAFLYLVVTYLGIFRLSRIGD